MPFERLPKRIKIRVGVDLWYAQYYHYTLLFLLFLLDPLLVFLLMRDVQKSICAARLPKRAPLPTLRRHMVRLVLFDIDGTLIQSGGAGEKAFGRVCATEFNIPNGTARLSFAGRTDRAIVREFFRNHRLEPSEENFRRFFEHYVFWWTPGNT